MINYIRQEIAKPGFDGFDAKDVKLFCLLVNLNLKPTKYSPQLSARYTISVVSNSIYNVDPKSFEGQESEILKTSQEILAPTKKFIISQMLKTVYPFLGRFLKLKFGKAGVEKFFVDLMDNAVKNREQSKVQRADFLDHLMNLKNKKEISGS